MSDSFVKRLIQVKLTMANTASGAPSTQFNGNNTKIYTGMRVECEITKGGHPTKNKSTIKIYGMLEDDMNALTSLSFQPMAVRKNLIEVLAGDETGLSTAFKGEIVTAYAQYSSPPNLFFHVEAVSGYYPAIVPVSPKSFQGSRSVASIMQDLATQMGYSFENNGVSSYLTNQVLPGTAFQQAAVVVSAADIEFGVDDGTLWIAPLGRPRKGNATLISPSSGMKEYPTFDKKGIRVECLYNPAIQLNGLISIQNSAVKKANGTWRVNGVKHMLESEKPGGQWFTKLSASLPNSLPSTPSTTDEAVL